MHSSTRWRAASRSINSLRNTKARKVQKMCGLQPVTSSDLLIGHEICGRLDAELSEERR
jgi:hypothetical protein